MVAEAYDAMEGCATSSVLSVAQSGRKWEVRAGLTGGEVIHIEVRYGEMMWMRKVLR
jgi:hypothetical protein